MILVTECSSITPVDHARATVNGSPPNLPIEHGTQVHFECQSGYASNTDLMAECGGTTPGVVEVSSLVCYKGNVLCKNNFQDYIIPFENLNDSQIPNYLLTVFYYYMYYFQDTLSWK